MAQLDYLSEMCNYTAYTEKWAYPPAKGAFPPPGDNIKGEPGCDLWHLVLDAALTVNPAFNVYRIFDSYPIPSDVLGSPLVFFSKLWRTDRLTASSGSIPDVQLPIYFNRTDVNRQSTLR